jgi:hypothetical protein
MVSMGFGRCVGTSPLQRLDLYDDPRPVVPNGTAPTFRDVGPSDMTVAATSLVSPSGGRKLCVFSGFRRFFCRLTEFEGAFLKQKPCHVVPRGYSAEATTFVRVPLPRSQRDIGLQVRRMVLCSGAFSPLRESDFSGFGDHHDDNHRNGIRSFRRPRAWR